MRDRDFPAALDRYLTTPPEEFEDGDGFEAPAGAEPELDDFGDIGDADSERPVYVRLTCDGSEVAEGAVSFVGVEEDFQGNDVLEFTCPKCGQVHKSLRFA